MSEGPIQTSTSPATNMGEVTVGSTSESQLKEASLIPRDHKRPMADPSSNSFNHQITINQQQQQQQHCIITCSEMRDVWINEIGPKLNVIDIVRLSMVNQWARHIAHNIKQHNGYSTVKSISKYREGVVCWPDLRWKLELRDWNSDDHTNDNTSDANDSNQCAVVSLVLTQCKVYDFSFVDTRRLEMLTLRGQRFPRLDARPRVAVANILVTCTGLASLSLMGCVSEHDDVEWLVSSLSHLTRVSHLDIRDNHLGTERMKQMCRVLICMSHITSLDLSLNHLGDDVMSYVSDCIRNMPGIKHLNLDCNVIGATGIKCICAALANKHHMTKLNVYANCLESEGARQLLLCATQLPRLCVLDIRNNGVNAQTTAQCVKLLSHVKHVKV